MDKIKDDPYLMDHNYDGIEELDNPMPTWWLITFFGTMIFAAIYFFHYEITESSSSDLELAEEMSEIQKLRDAVKMNTPQPETQDLNALVTNPEALTSGEKVYQSKCAACHGVKGEGQIGPNLTDTFWIHGEGTIEAIAKVINTGVTEKGMPAWGEMISGSEVNNTAAYILSLKGSNPPNAKKAEGVELK